MTEGKVADNLQDDMARIDTDAASELTTDRQPGNVAPQSAGRQRLRLRYAKDRVLMYISHRDLLRFVFKQFRRVEFPHAYSTGFSPKPRVSFGPALSLGVRADNELLDIEMKDGIVWDAAKLQSTLEEMRENSAPRHFAVDLFALPENTPNISKQAQQCRYSLQFDGDPDVLSAILENGDMNFVNHKGKASNQRNALLGHSIAEGRIELHADNSDKVLNIGNVVKLLSAQSGQTCTDMLRRCLMDSGGNEL
jgi:radical SAM-linked protein